MIVKANRQLKGVYGSKLTNDEFDVPEKLAADLIKRKLVRPAETKVVKPATSPTAPSARK